MSQLLHPRRPIGSLAHRAGRIMGQVLVSEIAARGYDFPLEFWPTLKLLVRSGRATVPQHEIAEHLVRNKATAARLLERMEAQGLVARVTDPHDRRQKCVSITPAGRAAYHELEPAALHTNAIALRGIDPARVEVCLDVLEQVFANLKAHD